MKLNAENISLDVTPDVRRVGIEVCPRANVTITFRLITGARYSLEMSAEEWDTLSSDVDRFIAGVV